MHFPRSSSAHVFLYLSHGKWNETTHLFLLKITITTRGVGLLSSWHAIEQNLKTTQKYSETHHYVLTHFQIYQIFVLIFSKQVRFCALPLAWSRSSSSLASCATSSFFLVLGRHRIRNGPQPSLWRANTGLPRTLCLQPFLAWPRNGRLLSKLIPPTTASRATPACYISPSEARGRGAAPRWEIICTNTQR